MNTSAIKVIKGIFVPVVTLALVGYAAWDLGLRINPTPSLPRGLYRIVPDVLPLKGDLVTFCLEGEKAAYALEREYLGAGSCPSGAQPLLKRLVGLPGEKVDLGGRVALKVDSQGREVKASADLEGGIIPSDMAVVLADHPGSFDSRYFGFVPFKSLQKVESILIFYSKVEGEESHGR